MDDVATLRTDLSDLQTDVWQQGDQVEINRDGVALALAMAGTAGLQSGETFALSANYGFYDDANALAFAGAARVTQHVSLNAGFGFGADTGEVGARAGVRWGW